MAKMPNAYPSSDSIHVPFEAESSRMSSLSLKGGVPLMSSLKRGISTSSLPIYKFVLTGGPCAGKTTCLERLSTYFRYVTLWWPNQANNIMPCIWPPWCPRERGFRVYMVPEASTLLQTGGAYFLYVKWLLHACFENIHVRLRVHTIPTRRPICTHTHT